MEVKDIERYDFFLNSEGSYTVKTVVGKEVSYGGTVANSQQSCQHRYFRAATLSEVLKKISVAREEDLASSAIP